MSDFWNRKLAGSAPPPHIPQAPAPSGTPGAWWQGTPVSRSAQGQLSPDAYQQAGSVMQPGHEDYQTLKNMRADEMSQGQMEALAELELQFDKYNQVCGQCGSTNFLPQGTKIGTARMGTDKCFDCGNSSSTLTSSPEPAHGATSGKAGRATRQTSHGGQGFTGRHHSELPTQYLPRQ